MIVRRKGKIICKPPAVGPIARYSLASTFVVSHPFHIEREMDGTPGWLPNAPESIRSGKA